MSAREPVTADDLEGAVSAVVSALQPAVDRDWSVLAGALEWGCRRTAEHLGDVLLSYAGQIAVQPQSRYVRFWASAEADASPAEILEFAEAAGRILAAVIRCARPDARAFHPTGMADPEGFAAMGCVETLVHGYDITGGLGITLDPPRDLCRRVLQRLFPATPIDADPWEILLWATDRADLPGRARPGNTWRWHGAPLDM